MVVPTIRIRPLSVHQRLRRWWRMRLSHTLGTVAHMEPITTEELSHYVYDFGQTLAAAVKAARAATPEGARGIVKLDEQACAAAGALLVNLVEQFDEMMAAHGGGETLDVLVRSLNRGFGLGNLRFGHDTPERL